MSLLKRLRLVLFILVGLAVVLPWLAVAVATIRTATSIQAPEVEQQVEAVGRGIVQRVDYATGLGIPLPDLVGVPRFFAEELSKSPELLWLALVDAEGRVRHLGQSRVHPQNTGLAVGRTIGERGITLGQRVIDLPLTAGGALLIGWHVPEAPQAVLSGMMALALALLVSLMVAWEVARFLWGTSAEASATAVTLLALRTLKGDLSGGVSTGTTDVLGRMAQSLTRLLRLTNYRLNELKALAGDVSSSLSDRSQAEAVTALGAAPAQGLVLAPEVANTVPPRRQMALTRFVVYGLALVMALPLVQEIERGGGEALGSTLWAITALLLPALLLNRSSLPALLPPRVAVAFGGGLIIAVLLAVPLIETLGSGLMLGIGIGLGFLIHPLRMACQAEERSPQEVTLELGMAIILGLFCGSGMGGMFLLLMPNPPLQPLAVVIATAMTLLAVTLLETRSNDDRRRAFKEAGWPNVQETAAVLARWPLMMLIVAVAVPTRLILTAVVFGLAPIILGALDVGPLGTTLALMATLPCMVLGVIVARPLTGTNRSFLFLPLLMGAIGLIVMAIPYSVPEVSIPALMLLLVLGSASHALRRDTVQTAADTAGHGLGAGRIERTVSLFEVLATTAGTALMALAASQVAAIATGRLLALVIVSTAVFALVTLLPWIRLSETAARRKAASDRSQKEAQP